MKKDFRNHPFRVNDTVYHPVFGEGVIDDIEDEPLCIRVNFKINGIALIYELSVMFLSFTPYEINSNWERPYEPKDGDIVKIVDFVGTEYEAIFKRRDSNNDIHTYAYSCIPCSDDGCAIDGGMFNSDAVITPSEGSDLFAKMGRGGFRWNAEKKELEKIPEPLKEGDLVIAWDKDLAQDAIVARYARGEDRDYQPSYICRVRGENLWFTNAVKFESMEQYKKIRRGEV